MWEGAGPNHIVTENSPGGGFDVADNSGSTGSEGKGGCSGFVHVAPMTNIS